MSAGPDIRWKQRFVNLEKALSLLEESLKNPAELNPLEQEGAVQRFEYTFELSWKTLKDFLEEGGVIITPLTPRQVIKEAFAAKLIPDGTAWLKMLDARNLLSHTYNSSVFTDSLSAITKDFLPLLKDLRAFLKEQK